MQVGFLPPSADLVKKSTHCLGRQMCAFFWRREWDSNPRGARTPNGFQDRLVMTTSISLQRRIMLHLSWRPYYNITKRIACQEKKKIFSIKIQISYCIFEKNVLLYQAWATRRDGWVGLRRTIGNRVKANTLPRVRISLSPPKSSFVRTGIFLSADLMHTHIHLYAWTRA